MRWCRQAVGAVAFIHSKDVIHSDLRPENYLVDDRNSSLNLYLCDFGGSSSGIFCGGNLPDAGFFDPRKSWEPSTALDIFSLGSVCYTIMTGHWPYKDSTPFKSGAEMLEYDTKVKELFTQGRFPPVESLAGGSIIQGCWTDQYSSAKAVLEAYIRLESNVY